MTASAGIVSVIGGPLPTGRRRSIDQVIRTTAPMHDGFAGGAFVDTGGALLGIATATAIRGLGVVIPAGIALEDGRHARSSTAGSSAGTWAWPGSRCSLPEAQRGEDGREDALLIVGVTPGGPAAAAGRPGRRPPSRLRRPRAVVAGGPAGSPDGRPHRPTRPAAGAAGRHSRWMSPSPWASVQPVEPMRVLLVGPAADRSRLRDKLEAALVEIAGEFPTLSLRRRRSRRRRRRHPAGALAGRR